MPPQPQQTQSLTIPQRIQVGQWVCQFPAITVMPWLRGDLGYRMVSPIRLFPIIGILVFVSIQAMPGNEDARPFDLLVFALLTLVIGIYQRIRRWIQLNQRVRQHSYYLGTSRFDSRRLPNFIRRNRKIARFVDPLVCILIGIAVFHVSRCLGAWLVFSGCCLRIYEYSVYQRDQNMTLDIMDGMMTSEHQSQIVEEFEASSGWQRQKNSNGIPTGLGDDIERQITISLKQRKIKKNQPHIDI